ncbi:hypothetical protein HELRODRAFT_175936 [Helobdella robusta]|uniref:Uncharacterized protein n=1 Tax=Helobdella robusta TaxID=6412 RepID=T1F9X6_HELRO|nr:hypothetical protein HELRODRAFT_175936 [Helobdella robusta]ESO00498.1 hypothetical protein HELRODRAFT_175936 [Helobdella robusta]
MRKKTKQHEKNKLSNMKKKLSNMRRFIINQNKLTTAEIKDINNEVISMAKTHDQQQQQQQDQLVDASDNQKIAAAQLNTKDQFRDDVKIMINKIQQKISKIRYSDMNKKKMSTKFYIHTKTPKTWRKELALIKEFMKGNSSPKITDEVAKICENYEVKLDKLNEVQKTIIMKLQAKAQRLRRYIRQIDGFWRQILENRVYHRNEADWITDVKRSLNHLKESKWKDLTLDLMKSLKLLKNLQIGKAQDQIEYKTSGLKN